MRGAMASETVHKDQIYTELHSSKYRGIEQKYVPLSPRMLPCFFLTAVWSVE
jgi:hypothetical protein